MLDGFAAFIKALLYAAILISSGVAYAAVTFRDTARCHEFAARVARRAAVALIVICLAGVVVLIARLGGQLDEATLSAVFSSTTGAALFMQLTGAALILSIQEDDSAYGMRLAAGCVIAFSLGFNGHAASMGPFQGLIAFAHVSAAAWWMGSILLLRHACLHYTMPTTVSVLRSFSAQAPRIVGGLIAAGLLLIFILLDFREFPILSAYEQTLAVKLILVAIVLFVAAYNKLSLTPRIESGDEQAVRFLKRSIDIELIIIGAILIATATLTTYMAPPEMGAN